MPVLIHRLDNPFPCMLNKRRRTTMTLVLRDPFDAMVPLREAMNRLFEESFIGPRFEFLTPRTFPVNIYETEDKQRYVIEAALSGFKPEEVQITAVGDTLTIVAAKKDEAKVEKGTYMRREHYVGEMSRTFTLPTFVDAEKVEAVFEQGVLKLYIPKAEEVKPKQIPVKIKEPAIAH
jgi:HSP20 family protein